MSPVQTKASFIACKAQLGCRSVAFQQDSIFILLLFVYLVLRETRWYASCSKPLYANGLRIAETIKAKWRGSDGLVGVLCIPAQCFVNGPPLWKRPFLFAAAKTIYKYRAGGGGDLGQLQDLKSDITEFSNSPTTIIHLGNPKGTMGGEREGGQIRGRGKEVKQRGDRFQLPELHLVNANLLQIQDGIQQLFCTG